MAGKTKTELQAENSNLKEELSNFKIDFKELSEKYENLQMPINLDNKNRTTTFRCDKCNLSFLSFSEYKKHVHTVANLTKNGR